MFFTTLYNFKLYNPVPRILTFKMKNHTLITLITLTLSKGILIYSFVEHAEPVNKIKEISEPIIN